MPIKYNELMEGWVSTPFDALKAVREELTGMNDVLSTIRRREQHAEASISEAENELNAIRKLRGYCEAEIGRLRERARKLEEEATK